MVEMVSGLPSTRTAKTYLTWPDSRMYLYKDLETSPLKPMVRIKNNMAKMITITTLVNVKALDVATTNGSRLNNAPELAENGGKGKQNMYLLTS